MVWVLAGLHRPGGPQLHRVGSWGVYCAGVSCSGHGSLCCKHSSCRKRLGSMRQLLGYLVSAKFQALATEMHILHPPPHPYFALPKRSWVSLDCLARMRPAGSGEPGTWSGNVSRDALQSCGEVWGAVQGFKFSPTQMHIFPWDRAGGIWAAFSGCGWVGKVSVSSNKRHLGTLTGEPGTPSGSWSKQSLAVPSFKWSVRNIFRVWAFYTLGPLSWWGPATVPRAWGAPCSPRPADKVCCVSWDCACGDRTGARALVQKNSR